MERNEWENLFDRCMYLRKVTFRILGEAPDEDLLWEKIENMRQRCRESGQSPIFTKIYQ